MNENAGGGGETRTAVVTGANRGLGLEVSHQLAVCGWRVIMTSRDPAKGAAAQSELARQGLEVDLRRVDVTRAEDARDLAAYIQRSYTRLDLLVNNAGVFLESRSQTGPQTGQYSADPLEVAPSTVLETVNINLLGPLRLIQALASGFSERARIVNVSSSMGQLSGMGDDYLGYRASKAALNALTRVMAAHLESAGVQVNACCPGWVRTGIGGERAERSVREGADTIVWLATSDEIETSGAFYMDRQPIPW